MTEERAPRARASRRELRAWAWVAGGLALVAPWAAVADPPEAAGHEKRPVLIVRTLTRRVIITHEAQPAGVQYVYVNGPSSSSSGSSPGGSSGGSGAPPPTTSTGGS